MTRLEICTAIQARLAPWSSSSGLPVYRRDGLPVEPPLTGYLSWAPEWGQEVARSRGGPTVNMGSVLVISGELFLPRASSGTAYNHEATIADLFRDWAHQSLHFVSWRAEQPEQKSGGPFFQLNFYLGLERYEDQAVAA